MPERIVKTPEQLESLSKFLSGLKLPLTIKWTRGQHRTNEQNRLMWLWCEQAAEYFDDRTKEDVQAEAKLIIGVPILRGDDERFREKYDRIIRPHDYDTKIEIMRDFDFPVTSVMRTSQMVQFMDELQARLLEQGVDLIEPDADLASYMARYRHVIEPDAEPEEGEAA